MIFMMLLYGILMSVAMYAIIMSLFLIGPLPIILGAVLYLISPKLLLGIICFIVFAIIAFILFLYARKTLYAIKAKVAKACQHIVGESIH